MNIKHKPCKAIGKALASDIYGCGKITYKRTYGLCDTCYKKWLYETPEGKEKQTKNLPKCKNCETRFKPYNNNSLQKHCMGTDECIKAHLEYQKEQEVKKAKRAKQKFHIDSMSKDQYRAKRKHLRFARADRRQMLHFAPQFKVWTLVQIIHI